MSLDNNLTWRIRNYLSPYYHKYILPIIVSNRQRNAIRSIEKKNNATVLFLVSNLSMWRCQNLYNLLSGDERFTPHIAIVPFSTYSEEQKESNLNLLRDYFSDLQVPFWDLSAMHDPFSFVQNEIAPDILFFPQPFSGVIGKDLDFSLFEKKLLCYSPYGINTFEQPWIFNLRFSNVAWKLYFPSDVDRVCAKKYAYNKGRNMVIVGSTTADRYSVDSLPEGIWKESGAGKKKIIWAPHFSINEDGYLHRASFLTLAEPMLRLCEKYRDTIQFAFKPHPRLVSELYKHPDWGPLKTDTYFAEWSRHENTQLETGGFIDLFLTSDGMIHDCGSFTAEYHYTGKPALFITDDKGSIEEMMTGLGKAALNAHYFGKTIEDIEEFLDHVILKGEDPKKHDREEFHDTYLLPPHGRNAAENIYEDLLESLPFKK